MMAAPPPPPEPVDVPPHRRLDALMATWPGSAAAFGGPRRAFGGWHCGPQILGPLAEWRAAHPDALVVNVSGRRDLTDADFVYLRGLAAVDMSHCDQATITDAAFAHLAGIHSLNMSGCRQATITDAAFAHLAGIHTLDMSGCAQATITDAAFAHLAGIHTLDMSGCTQPTITGAGLVYLTGIHTLDVTGCAQVPGAALARLGHVQWLSGP
jgi:hypothetical protein